MRRGSRLRLVPVRPPLGRRARRRSSPASRPALAAALWARRSSPASLRARRRRARAGAGVVRSIVLVLAVAAAATHPMSPSRSLRASASRSRSGADARSRSRRPSSAKSSDGPTVARVRRRATWVDIGADCAPGRRRGVGAGRRRGCRPARDARCRAARSTAHGSAIPRMPGDRAVLDAARRAGSTVREAARWSARRHGRRCGRGSSQRPPGCPAARRGALPGLAVGDTSAVEPELDAAMKAVVAVAPDRGIGGELRARRRASRSPRPRLRRARGASASRVAARRPSPASSLLVTPEPSVVRAATMAAVAMVGVLLGRPAAGMAVLSLAVDGAAGRRSLAGRRRSASPSRSPRRRRSSCSRARSRAGSRGCCRAPSPSPSRCRSPRSSRAARSSS